MSGRYIDADKLAEYEENAWDWETVDYINTTTALNQVISDIRHETPADVRPNVHGEWVINDIDNGKMNTKCSKCGDYFWNYGDWKFCPNCGADMRKGETNE